LLGKWQTTLRDTFYRTLVLAAIRRPISLTFVGFYRPTFGRDTCVAAVAPRNVVSGTGA